MNFIIDCQRSYAVEYLFKINVKLYKNFLLMAKIDCDFIGCFEWNRFSAEMTMVFLQNLMVTCSFTNFLIKKAI